MIKKPTAQKEPATKIRFSAWFKETFAKHRAVEAKLNEFMRLKLQNPLARFGSTDEHFTGDGPLKETGVIHAHLTGNISVLYKRHGKNPTYIDMYGIATHDELGTGQPGSPKQQKKVAKILDKQVFEMKAHNA